MCTKITIRDVGQSDLWLPKGADNQIGFVRGKLQALDSVTYCNVTVCGDQSCAYGSLNTVYIPISVYVVYIKCQYMLYV